MKVTDRYLHFSEGPLLKTMVPLVLVVEVPETISRLPPVPVVASPPEIKTPPPPSVPFGKKIFQRLSTVTNPEKRKYLAASDGHIASPPRGRCAGSQHNIATRAGSGFVDKQMYVTSRSGRREASCDNDGTTTASGGRAYYCIRRELSQ